MDDTNLFPKHNLSGKTKQRVFDALLERQQGKCFICGKSQEDLQNMKPLAMTLYIDHCHKTGMVRGLLCGTCNAHLGHIENGCLEIKPAPITICDDNGEIISTIPCPIDWVVPDWVPLHRWLERYKDIVSTYMQQERWYPRKDILFHLQSK